MARKKAAPAAPERTTGGAYTLICIVGQMRTAAADPVAAALAQLGAEQHGHSRADMTIGGLTITQHEYALTVGDVVAVYELSPHIVGTKIEDGPVQVRLYAQVQNAIDALHAHADDRVVVVIYADDAEGAVNMAAQCMGDVGLLLLASGRADIERMDGKKGIQRLDWDRAVLARAKHKRATYAIDTEADTRQVAQRIRTGIEGYIARTLDEAHIWPDQAR